MKNFYLLLILCLLSLLSCDSSETIDDCELIVGFDAVTLLTECARITDSSEAENQIVGTWNLCAYACGFCDPSQTDAPSVKVILETTGKGFSSYSNSTVDKDYAFDWSIEKDTFGNIYLDIEPKVWFIQSSLICSEQFGKSGAARDGPTYVYSRKDAG